MTPAPVIRLHPDDAVLIARSSLPPGMVVAEGVTTVERIPAGHIRWRSARSRPARRSGAMARSSALPPCRSRRPACPHPELRHGRFRQGLCFRRRCHADAEFRSARDLRRHRPPRRPGRDPQLYRHPYFGELQRPCRGPGRRYLQEESVHPRQSAGGFSQCRWRGRADPQDRLRHDPGRAADASCAGPSAATRGMSIFPP